MQGIESEESEPEPEGLGGWLIVVAVGLVGSLAFMAMQFARDLLPIFFDERWSMLTSPSSDAYHPLWAPLLVFETVMSLGFFVVSVVALVLFFRRSPRFPRIMIAYYAATLLFVAADLGLSSLLPGMAAQIWNDPQAGRQLGQSVMTCAIWIPYMRRSRRVHNTFVGRSSLRSD
jgi:hypothetical protein